MKNLSILFVLLLSVSFVSANEAFFVKMLDSADAAVRKAAVEEIGKIADPQDATVQKVATLLADADAAVRAQAVITLGKFGVRGTKALETKDLLDKVAIFKDATKPDAARLAAIQALVGKDLSDAILVEVQKCAIKDVKENVRQVAFDIFSVHMNKRVSAKTTEMTAANQQIAKLEKQVKNLEKSGEAMALKLADSKSSAGDFEVKLKKAQKDLEDAQKMAKETNGAASLKIRHAEFFSNLSSADVDSRMRAMQYVSAKKAVDLKDVVIAHLMGESVGNVRFWGVQALIDIGATGCGALVQHLISTELSVNRDCLALYKVAMTKIK